MVMVVIIKDSIEMKVEIKDADVMKKWIKWKLVSTSFIVRIYTMSSMPK